MADSISLANSAKQTMFSWHTPPEKLVFSNLWENRLKSEHPDKLLLDYFQQFTGTPFSSQKDKIDEWIYNALSAIVDCESEGQLVELLSSQQPPSVIWKWLNKIYAKLKNTEENNGKARYEHLLACLVKNIGIDNTQSLLGLCFQLARHLNESNGAHKQSQTSQHLFEELLSQLITQYPTKFQSIPSKLTFDKEKVSKDFLVHLEQTAANTKRRQMLIGGMALAILGTGGLYTFYSRNHALHSQKNSMTKLPSQANDTVFSNSSSLLMLLQTMKFPNILFLFCLLIK
jgi:hypothetical protein